MQPSEVFVGAIDQGTTSTRFLIINHDGEPVASHQVEFNQIYPYPGYVYLQYFGLRWRKIYSCKLDRE